MSEWPTIVVLNTERTMRAFREHAAQSGKPLDFPDEIAAEIVCCLKHARKATMRLEQFFLSILMNDFDHRYAMYTDSTVITFVQELGEEMLERIHHHNLYDERGVLHYRYREPRSADFNCIVLKRVVYEPKDQHQRQTFAGHGGVRLA